MPVNTMMLKVLLPFQIFVDTTEVVRIVAETSAGSVGLLPNRLDCVAVLVPGILIYEPPQGGEVFIAVDEGVLVKTGGSVRISVRRAIAGTDLEQLHEQVEQAFLHQGASEQQAQWVMAKLETGFLRRFARFQHE